MESIEPQSSQISPFRPPTVAGLVIAVLTVALIVAGAFWIRGDRRYQSSVILTAAANLILSRAAVLPEPHALFEAAAEGMISTLDPFSAFMPPDEYEYFAEETGGSYVGIGVEFRVARPNVVIVHVYPQSPASDAMIRAGDRILRIDSIPMSGKTVSEVVEAMRGDVDEPVTLFLESTTDQTRHVTLYRRRITVTPFPVAGVNLSGIAYIRWAQFSEGSGDRLAALMADLAMAEPIGLVLDLRGNPGGLLEEAVAGAESFLPPASVVCRLRARSSRAVLEFVTDSTPGQYTGPLICLIDEASASAAEVLVSALHDHGRAISIGRASFGKSWAQSMFPIADAGMLRLSTAILESPSGAPVAREMWAAALTDESDPEGRWAPGRGINPDTAVLVAEPGPWELALAESGGFSEFETMVLSDRFGDVIYDSEDVLESLWDWCLQTGRIPVATGGDLIAEIKRVSESGTIHDDSGFATLRDALGDAWDSDSRLLFARESDRLLQRIWEQHLLNNERPDPAELSSYFDLDPDCMIARDLLEVIDAYERLLGRSKNAAAVSARAAE